MAPDLTLTREPAAAADLPSPDVTRVFHRLNNQLGIILANAELLEARLTDETQRARASQVVAGALDAISTIQDLRRIVGLLPTTER